MKKTLSMITLAVLSMGLLGSCSKINERLDGLDRRIDGLENERIASIDKQIENINSSIADLGTIRDNIKTLTNDAKEQGEEIADLQAADEALSDRIDDLKKYVNDTIKGTIEWVNATFSTLAQYEATCDTIAKIDARLGSTSEKLSNDIKACADSMARWINGKFEGYYTAAQMDAKLAQMKSAIDSSKASGKISEAKADSIATELTNAKAAVDTAKANIRAEYTATIDTAIKTIEGKLTKEITDRIATVNAAVTDLTTRVTKLESAVDALIGMVLDLVNMIQAVTIVPDYRDGGVRSADSVLTLTCCVSPAKALKGLKKEYFTLLYKKVKEIPVYNGTKAAGVSTIDIERTTFDYDEGTVEVKADVREYMRGLEDDEYLSVALKIKPAGVSDYTTDFVPVHNDALTYAYLIKSSEFRSRVVALEPPVSFFMTKGSEPEKPVANYGLTAVIFHTKWAGILPSTEDAAHKKVAKSATDKPGSLEEDLWAVLENNTEVHVYTKKDIIIPDDDMTYMFAEMFGLKIVDMTGVRTGETANMSHMFENATKMESLILGNGFTIPTEDSNKKDMFKKFAFESGKGVTVAYEAGAEGDPANDVMEQIQKDNPGSKVEKTTDPVTGDVIIKASSMQNYAVIFDLNDVTGTAPETQYIAKNGIAKKPADPTAAGYSFNGWYKEKACTSPWNFATDKVVSDTTLFACWDWTIGTILSTVKPEFPKSNVVSEVPDTAWTSASDNQCKCYVAPGETGGNALWVKKNHTDSLCLPLAKVASREGDTWKYTDEGATWTFKMINDELASIAFAAKDSKYTALNGTYSVSFTVTFVNPEGDVNVASTMPAEQKNILKGNKASRPGSPTDQSGFHTLEGWYKTKDASTGELSDKWDFNTDVVMKDITLYAQWQTPIEKILVKAAGEFPHYDKNETHIDSLTERSVVENAIGEKMWKATTAYGTGCLYKGKLKNDDIIIFRAPRSQGGERIESTSCKRQCLKTGNKYKAEGTWAFFTFTIDSNVFTQVVFSAKEGTTSYAQTKYCDGTYTPPTPN